MKATYRVWRPKDKLLLEECWDFSLDPTRCSLWVLGIWTEVIMWKDNGNPICLHLRTRPDFRKGHKAPASRIDHKSQKLVHKTPALGTSHKIQNKIIKPPPKEQPGDNHKNGEISYLRMGHLCWAALSHPVVKSSWHKNADLWPPVTL